MVNRLLFFFLSLILLQLEPAFAGAKKGVLDASNLRRDEVIKLDGRWQFYWKRLLRPEEINPNISFEYIDFPSVWNQQVIGTDTLTGHGFATYRLVVKLPDEPREYAIFVDDVYTSFQLFVNGQVMATNGQVGTQRSLTTPEWRPHVVYIGEHQTSMEIVLQISNFHHSKGGATDHFLFGEYDAVSDFYLTKTVNDLLLAFSFLILGVFFLYSYGFNHFPKSSLFFGLFLITYTYRIVGSDYYILHQYVPEIPWSLGIHLEYLSLFLSTLFFTYFVDAMYPAEFHKVVKRVAILISTAFTFITLFTTPAFFSTIITPYFIFLIVGFLYVFLVFVSAVINGKAHSKWGLSGIITMIATFLYLIFGYYGWLPVFDRLVTIALLVSFSLLSMQLFLHREKHTSTFAGDLVYQ